MATSLRHIYGAEKLVMTYILALWALAYYKLTSAIMIFIPYLRLHAYFRDYDISLNLKTTIRT